MFGPSGVLERVLCVPAALLLLYLEPVTVTVGLALLAAAVVVHLVHRRRSSAHAVLPA
jgi:hypothetical protein